MEKRDETIWHWSQTAMDVIRKQNEVEAKIAPFFDALRRELSEAITERLIAEGIVATRDGELPIDWRA